MRSTTRMGSAALVTLAALTMTANSAFAASTTIHRDTAAGAAYSENFEIGGLTNSSLTIDAGGNVVTCDHTEIDGITSADGATASIDDVLIEDSSDTANGTCPGSAGTRTSIDEAGLPYAGATIQYAPNGTANGTLSTPNLQLKATTTVGSQIRTCYYGGTGENGRITFDLYNRDNPNRPNSTVDDLQAKVNGARLALDPAQTSDPTCAAAVTVTGVLIVRGETVEASGVYDQKLYLSS